MMSERLFTEIGTRLAAVRQAFSLAGESQKAFAERNGFEFTQWNNWEKGTRRISVDEAIKLAGLYGLTLDFIYMGRRDGLADRASKVL